MVTIASMTASIGGQHADCSAHGDPRFIFDFVMNFQFGHVGFSVL